VSNKKNFLWSEEEWSDSLSFKFSIDIFWVEDFVVEETPTSLFHCVEEEWFLFLPSQLKSEQTKECEYK
jgi:hypothetical protein